MRPILIAYLVALSAPAIAQEAVPILPDLSKTPGAVNSELSQAVVCNGAFTTKTFRKASKRDRKCVLSRYGYPAYAFTYDHLVPLELGGSDSCDNLWPQARAEAKRKDALEAAMHRQVCACGGLTLSAAQDAIRTNWLTAYQRYVTPKGAPFCAVNGGPPS